MRRSPGFEDPNHKKEKRNKDFADGFKKATCSEISFYTSIVNSTFVSFESTKLGG